VLLHDRNPKFVGARWMQINTILHVAKAIGLDNKVREEEEMERESLVVPMIEI